MKSFKSKTIDGFAISLEQRQLLVIRAGNCCNGDGGQEPPDDPPKSAIATIATKVLGS